jgi:2-oxoglutarate ferredoxin oxidoreductase subunit alpha
MPVQELVKAANLKDKRLRDYIANMVYVGVLAQLLGIDLDLIEDALNFHFKGKTGPVKSNMGVVLGAAEWTRENIEKCDPYRVEPMQRDEDLIIIDGNTAGALGAVFGGVTFAAWYPITPSTSLMDALTTYLGRLRADPDSGDATYAIVQSEDELSAIGVVLGAGWMGARSMTATAGPGISLMAENVGYGYYAEIPTVIWDVQRMGPSTGLPTRTAQCDLLSTYFLSHGETRHIILLPSTMAECFEFGGEAFNLAERFQTPIFVLSDLDLGMNPWMSEPFEYPEKPLDRGKVLAAEDVERQNGFNRYEDVDGDGIPYRTLPGTDHPKAAYFTRGSAHDHRAVYSERADDWERNMARLALKHNTARSHVPAPVLDEMSGAEVGLIAYGSTHPAIVEARDRLEAQGFKTSYLRVRALPFNDEVRAFIESYDRVYVVENNGDGQMAQLLRLDYPDLTPRIYSTAHGDGLPLTARWITDAIMEQEG